MTRIAEFMTDAAAGIIAAAFILSQPRSVDGFLELLLHSHLPAGWSDNPWTELMYIHKLNWRTEISVREASFAFNFD